MFYNVLRVWFDAKIKKKMDIEKTKLEVNEVFPKRKKASIKLYTVLVTVFYSNIIYSNNSNIILTDITISDIKAIVDAMLWFVLLMWIWFVRYLLINRKDQ